MTAASVGAPPPRRGSTATREHCHAWHDGHRHLGDDGGVQYAVTCHACGTSWQSTSVTGSTRCGSCHTPVYVPLAVRQAAVGRPLS
jgi:hypothetical protein